MRDSILQDFGIPPEVVEHVGFNCQFDTRDTERALADSDIAVPELDTYATKLWDYWERVLDPDLYKDRSFEHAVNGKTVVITGASSGIGLSAALKIAKAGGIPILVARSMDKLEAARAEIEPRAARPTPTAPTSARWTRSTTWWRASSPTTRRSTCWSTTPAARSAARSRSATIASTTSSAPSSSTTSARSS